MQACPDDMLPYRDDLFLLELRDSVNGGASPTHQPGEKDLFSESPSMSPEKPRSGRHSFQQEFGKYLSVSTRLCRKFESVAILLQGNVSAAKFYLVP